MEVPYDTLVVDDLRTLRAPARHVRTSAAGIALLTYEWATLYLDHDLGESDDILPVVDYMCERAHNGDPVKVETVFVHSQNPVGAANVVRALTRYGYNVKRIGVEQFIA